MTELQEIIIRLLFALMNIENDFIEGLIEALKRGLALNESDSKAQLAAFVETACAFPGDGPAEIVLREAAALCANLSSMASLEEKRRIISSIAELCDADKVGRFGDRIVYTKIEALVRDLKY